MFYRDYFTRSEDNKDFDISLYKSKITSSIADQRKANLFKDCFSNHVDFICQNVTKLEFNIDSKSRYITRDNLSSYFINNIYKIPDITKFSTGEKCDFEEFLIEFIENSFASKKESNKFNLGSNRLRFIVGKVGEGKSAFIKKIISVIKQKKRDFDSEYELLPIYINLEDRFNYGFEPKPLKGEFLPELYNKIYEEARNCENEIDFKELNGINPINQSILALKLIISELKAQKVRLLIFIDNLDFYHYYYARYSFFPKYNKQQERAINDNIMWLLSIFNSSEYLGHMGLNILFAARQYVYEDLATKADGTETDITTTDAIKISVPSEEIIFNTRFELLSNAIDVVEKNMHGAGRDLREIFEALQTKLLSGKFNMTSKSPIKIINSLGQHGNRSLVAFFSGLNVTYLDFELIDRFLIRQVSTLYILYFNNIYKKYTQNQNHFPNLYLVDCLVMDGKDFEDAHQPHMHTYWLKYFILKTIVNREKIKFNEIMDMFCAVGDYDDHLVRHVVGSLCTANEFRCAEVDYDETCKNLETYKIRPTERGRRLYSKTNGIEVCLDFEYLQTVIDDYWLSLPNQCCDSIYLPKANYSYLYYASSKYINASIDTVLMKAEAILNFIKVLEAAYLIEIKQNMLIGMQN